MLSDWTDEGPDPVFGNLKKQSDHYNYHEGTAGTFLKGLPTRLASEIAEFVVWFSGIGVHRILLRIRFTDNPVCRDVEMAMRRLRAVTSDDLAVS
jgi:hypothetical protein